MKVLVTGATGFIGKYVVDELLKQDCEIIVTSRSKEIQQNWLTQKRITFKQLDFDKIEPSTNYFEALGQPDKLIHLAWQGLPNYKKLFHFETNLPQQYSFLKNIVENGLKHITVTGTCFEYGMQEGELSEEMLVKPANPYALAKHTLHCFLQELQKHQPFQLNWIRLFYMYGKGQNTNSLYSQLNMAIEKGDVIFNMSGGEQERDFLPVEVVANNIVAITMLEKEIGLVNCCSSKPIKVKDWVINYLKTKKSNLQLNLGHYPYADYEPMRFWGSDKKLNTSIHSNF